MHTHHHKVPVRHKDHIEEIKKKAIVSSILTLPILAFSESFQRLIGFKIPEFYGSKVIVLLLSSFIFVYGGSFFIKGSLEELKKKKPGMFSLVALAISVAFLYSLYATLQMKMDFFWELSTLIVVMLWGHWIEMRSTLGASKALEELMRLMPTKANLVKGDKIIEVPVSELTPGDIVLVKPGEKVPVDGVVVEGSSYLNEAMLTGESKPVYKSLGDKVIGGSLNMEGSLKVKVEKTGEEAYVGQVIKLVKETQESKTRLQDMADKVAFYLTLIAVFVGFISFSLWVYLAKDLSFAVERAVSVMVIACPHALGLAIPLVVAMSTSYLAKNGILIRKRIALELLRKVDVVVFDKTGTLTEGVFGVSELFCVNMSEKELIRLTSAVEKYSEHVIGKAIREFAQREGISIPEVKGFKAVSGKGVLGEVEGKAVAVGTLLLMEELGIVKDMEVLKRVDEFEAQGKSSVLVALDGRLIGAIALSDKPRPEAYEAVRELKNMGKKVMMITGDSEVVARHLAKELGIEEYIARVLPHQKAQKIKELQSKGMRVAMVGDGINDAPALVQADVGIAIGSGTDVAIESADIVLVKSDLRDVVKVIKTSSITVSKMVQNLFWAVGYNVLAIPLAAGIAFPWGIILKPAIGALFMSASTLIVAINAMLMKRFLE
ncbi:MAG: heavy metal translocating P-type ATPase [Hydrogenobacter sp.]